VLADGTVRTWGWNSSGQLGDGTLIDRNLAVAVPGVGGATKVGGGGEGHSVVLVVSATPPQDLAPTASFTHECQALECTFDAASSVDPEGGALSYAWSFGDGSGSSARLITHAFSAAANYTVRLTVTDPGGQTNTLTRQVAVAEAPTGTVAFRAARSSNTSATRPAVTVPAVVQPGDVLLLFATTNRNATMSTPSGWTLLGTRLDGADLESWLFTRLAATDTAGSTITTQLDALSKVSLTLLAYSGAGPVQSSASTGETVVRATHLSPSVQVSTPGSRVVSHWVDRTDGHTGWTLPASVIGRNNNTGTGSARLTAVTGDSGPVATGTWQGVTATSGASSGKAVSWSVVVPSA
jgi:PKD repeat protein